MAKTLRISGLKFVHIPPPAEAEVERLILVMHGLGDSLEGYRFMPRMLGIPGLHFLLVNAPDTYFGGYSWFDLYGDMEAGVLRSRKMLFTVLDEVFRQGWLPQHVGVFGFSQGCLMALDLACRYPKTLGAVVGVSGFLAFLDQYPEQLSPVAREQRILVTHGTEDPLLPYEVSKRQIHTLRGMGLNIQWKVYPKEHTIDPHEEVGDIRDFVVKNLFRE
jgi:phospholipase/carboxylesterase